MKHLNFLFFFLPIFIHAQSTFRNETDAYLANINLKSRLVGITADFNNDLVDDVISIEEAVVGKLIFNNGKIEPWKISDSITISTGTQWTSAVGDFNNDGYSEFVNAGVSSSVFINTVKDSMIEPYAKILFPHYAQGAATVDINNDGWLDLFVSNDEGPSLFYINDGFGNLVETDLVNFETTPMSDMSGNYNVDFSDYNNDGLMDFHIAKCRAGVDDPEDGRRINSLYMQQVDGSFIDEARNRGLASGRQSWVGAFGDIDNDGDIDGYIANHYEPHQLMLNDGNGYFTEIPINSAFSISNFTLQAIMRDFDNDGFLDILCAGIEGNFLLTNLHNQQFQFKPNNFESINNTSFVCSDFNLDGFLDVITQTNEPLNFDNLGKDQVFINEGNENHYFKCVLYGNQSSVSAVGAIINIFGPWGIQTRTIKGGESYGIFNSLHQIFGLGTENHIDSLQIIWPAGTIDTYTDLEGDQTAYFQEGICYSYAIQLPDEQIFDTPITIQLPAGFATYAWNDGTTTQEKIVTKSGDFFAEMTDSEECVTKVLPVHIIDACFTETTKVFTRDTLNFCTSSAEISSIEGAKYLWSNADTTQITTIYQSGDYVLTVTDFCHQSVIDSVYIRLNPYELKIENDTIYKGDDAELVSNIENTFWYKSIAGNYFANSQILEIQNVLNDTSFYANFIVQLDGKTKSVGIQAPIPQALSNNNFNAKQYFTVHNDVLIKSFDVWTDSVGTRIILIQNQAGDTVFRKLIHIEKGLSTLNVQAMLQKGQYTILTDEKHNASQFGYNGPRLTRHNVGVNYPYEIEDVISITNSSLGLQNYYYFYNWQVEYDIKLCISDFIEVKVIAIDTTDNVDGFDKFNISFGPNPTSGEVAFYNLKDTEYQLAITSLKGDIISRAIISKNSPKIDMSHLPKGMYLMTISLDDISQSYKIMVE